MGGGQQDTAIALLRAAAQVLLHVTRHVLLQYITSNILSVVHKV
jgi:hypothetical protein